MTVVLKEGARVHMEPEVKEPSPMELLAIPGKAGTSDVATEAKKEAPVDLAGMVGLVDMAPKVPGTEIKKQMAAETTGTGQLLRLLVEVEVSEVATESKDRERLDPVASVELAIMAARVEGTEVKTTAGVDKEVMERPECLVTSTVA